jgi:hypothetical protein
MCSLISLNLTDRAGAGCWLADRVPYRFLQAPQAALPSEGTTGGIVGLSYHLQFGGFSFPPSSALSARITFSTCAILLPAREVRRQARSEVVI